MAAATIQSSSTRTSTPRSEPDRHPALAQLFKPGTYGGNEANVGYYTSIAGLGQNPDDVTINGNITVDAFNASDAGNATQNFWRSAENLAINPAAATTAGPWPRPRRSAASTCTAAWTWSRPATAGPPAATWPTPRCPAQESSSQQQWYTRDSNLGSWDGGVWNMVFSGVTGAPANTFPTPPETVLGTTPVSRDVPYLYIDSTGKYRVFLPSLRTNASGPSWASGWTPGTSLPMSQFYVVKPGDTASTINAALTQGCNLFFTPGVYHVNQTLNVTGPTPSSWASATRRSSRTTASTPCRWRTWTACA